MRSRRRRRRRAGEHGHASGPDRHLVAPGPTAFVAHRLSSIRFADRVAAPRSGPAARRVHYRPCATASLAALRAGHHACDRACSSSGSPPPCAAASSLPSTVADVAEHPNDLVVAIPRSKTNQTGDRTELVVLPRASRPTRCPVTALEQWLTLAAITDRRRFCDQSPRATDQAPAGLNPETINDLVQTGRRTRRHRPRARTRPTRSRRIRHLRPPPRRHRPGNRPPDPSPLCQATSGQYVRVHEAWDDNAATQLGLQSPQYVITKQRRDKGRCVVRGHRLVIISIITADSK